MFNNGSAKSVDSRESPICAGLNLVPTFWLFIVTVWGATSVSGEPYVRRASLLIEIGNGLVAADRSGRGRGASWVTDGSTVPRADKRSGGTTNAPTAMARRAFSVSRAWLMAGLRFPIPGGPLHLLPPSHCLS
ncbi:hypothetical protein BJ956_002584 [Arthrobacter psychrochitiniphilus]|nr:hypothetical protein [Arthrobacter psychrochitiniphilus]